MPKNFSILIEPEGRFRMTPLYNIMSAHPLMARRQLHKKKIKMAMALMGNNRHYHWHNIQPRHFISTANHVGFNKKVAELLFAETMDSVDEVIRNVERQIPADFPDRIASPIFKGMRKQRDRSLTASGSTMS